MRNVHVLPERSCAACRSPLTSAGVRDIRLGGHGDTATAMLGALAQIDESFLRVALYGGVERGRLEMFLPPASPA